MGVWVRLDEEGVGDEFGDAVEAGDDEFLVACLASQAKRLEDLAGPVAAHTCPDELQCPMHALTKRL